MNLYEVTLLAVLLVVIIVCFFLDSIGPKSFRDWVRKRTTWYYKDAAFFLPLDPYKPFPEAVREGWKHFWPTKERLKNSESFLNWFLGIVILGIVVSLVAAIWASKLSQ